MFLTRYVTCRLAFSHRVFDWNFLSRQWLSFGERRGMMEDSKSVVSNYLLTGSTVQKMVDWEIGVSGDCSGFEHRSCFLLRGRYQRVYMT